MSAIEPSPLSVPTSAAVPPEPVTTCHTAYFSARWPHPAIAVVSAHGELDAANAQDFAAYALQHVGKGKQIVLDLAGVEFFGTAGFSALHTLNVRCAGDGVDWAMVPATWVPWPWSSLACSFLVTKFHPPTQALSARSLALV